MSLFNAHPHPGPLPRGEGETVAATWTNDSARFASVQGHHARTISGQFLPSLAIAVCLAGLFGGCYSFSGAREEIRQNQEQEATINREIQKEQDRERELENSTNFPATNSPSK